VLLVQALSLLCLLPDLFPDLIEQLLGILDRTLKFSYLLFFFPDLF